MDTAEGIHLHNLRRQLQDECLDLPNPPLKGAATRWRLQAPKNPWQPYGARNGAESVYNKYLDATCDAAHLDLAGDWC